MYAEVFEAVMLVCFGCSWPVLIAKTLRVRKVHGQSPVFLLLVLIGYLSGIAAKLILAGGGVPSWVTLLYAFNAINVAVAIVLYFRFHQPEAEGGVTIEPEPPAAEVTDAPQ